MSEPHVHDPVAGSRFFQWREFAVSASHPELVRAVPDALRPNVERWVETIGDPIRRMLGRPMPVLSSYRSAELNAAIGGSPTSQHLIAEAVDVTCEQIGAVFRALLARPNPMPSGQVIYYPDQAFVHVALPSERYPAPSFHVHRPSRGLQYRVVSSLSALDALLAT